jgi:hypothetical protein
MLGSAGFNSVLQLGAGVESNNSAGRDSDFLSRLWISPRSLRLVSQLKISEACKFYFLARLQACANFTKEGLDHFLGFATSQTNTVDEVLREVEFGDGAHRDDTV